jgi:hypothetical protein
MSPIKNLEENKKLLLLPLPSRSSPPPPSSACPSWCPVSRPRYHRRATYSRPNSGPCIAKIAERRRLLQFRRSQARRIEAIPKELHRADVHLLQHVRELGFFGKVFSSWPKSSVVVFINSGDLLLRGGKHLDVTAMPPLAPPNIASVCAAMPPLALCAACPARRRPCGGAAMRPLATVWCSGGEEVGRHHVLGNQRRGHCRLSEPRWPAGRRRWTWGGAGVGGERKWRFF